jgi:hypothetical protein
MKTPLTGDARRRRKFFARVQTVWERPVETETELTAGFAEKENPGANRSQTDKLPRTEIRQAAGLRG